MRIGRCGRPLLSGKTTLPQGGLGGQTLEKVSVPEIGFQFRASLVNFFFYLVRVDEWVSQGLSPAPPPWTECEYSE